MIYRYEIDLGKEGNFTIGIFHRLWELEREMRYSATAEEQKEYASAVARLKRDLPCPMMFRRQVEFWFTEKGNQKFKEEIKTLMYYVSIYLPYRTIVRRIREYDKGYDPVYRDEYQLCFELYPLFEEGEGKWHTFTERN